MSEKLNLCAGEWVEVRSKDEILRTLDKDGRLEGLPFMPEMFAFAGRRLRVAKRAHKTCDTVFPIRGRRMADAVHLETRCNGQAHGGCEAGCLIFWKEAWLKRISDGPAGADKPISEPGTCTEEDVNRATRVSGDKNEADPTYVCQATQLPYFTTELSPWEMSQYIEDYKSGNVGLGTIARGFIYMAYNTFANMKTGIGLGRFLRWLYDVTAGLRRGLPYPRHVGPIPVGVRTPAEDLQLQPGELVRVKSYEQILATCDQTCGNRGMKFDAEMVPYCGGTYRVHKRVTHIINEKNGKMLPMKTPCIILEGVICEGRYSECRLFCPRAIYPYWREIWLERIPVQQAGSLNSGSEARSDASLQRA